MATNVHPNAQAGFATGTNESYDRVRPPYPADCLSYARRQVPKSTTPLKIVEIGAGTGIFTRALLNHPEWATSIGTLRAIEPSDGMRDFWMKRVQDNRCTIVNGTFDNTAVEDGWADLIIIAQAFHWCLDYGKAFTEFARILNKDGVALFIWYLADRFSVVNLSYIKSSNNAIERLRVGLHKSSTMSRPVGTVAPDFASTS